MGNEGHYFLDPGNSVSIESIGGPGFLPSGIYIRVVAKKGGASTSGTLYVNIQWAKIG